VCIMDIWLRTDADWRVELVGVEYLRCNICIIG
jgi:hypothetical protein